MSHEEAPTRPSLCFLIALLGAMLLTIGFGCSAQFKELPEDEAVVACQEQGYQRGSLAFADCVEGGVESIKPLPAQ